MRPLLTLVLLAAAVFIAHGCKCRVQPPKVTYCKAHWVAHTRISITQTKQKMPNEIAYRQGLLTNIRYNVKHLQVFKVPSEFNGTLPEVVYSPSEDAACGIILETGHEYLLSGRVVNGTLLTQLCGQILYDDLNKAKFEDILEWREVPENTKSRLQSKGFEPCSPVEEEKVHLLKKHPSLTAPEKAVPVAPLASSSNATVDLPPLTAGANSTQG